MIEYSACIELTHRLLSTNPIVTVQGVMDDACGRSVRSGVISAVYAVYDRVISDHRSFSTCSVVWSCSRTMGMSACRRPCSRKSCAVVQSCGRLLVKPGDATIRDPEMSSNPPLICTGDQKVRKLASVCTSLDFEWPAFENAARCLNSETNW